MPLGLFCAPNPPGYEDSLRNPRGTDPKVTIRRNLRDPDPLPALRKYPGIKNQKSFFYLWKNLYFS
jgi:hypothetical protein